MNHNHYGIFVIISYNNIKSKISNVTFISDMTKFRIDDFLLALNHSFIVYVKQIKKH